MLPAAVASASRRAGVARRQARRLPASHATEILRQSQAFRCVPAAGMAVSNDGSFLVTISRDQSVKVFDVAAFDMVLMLRLPFVPKAAEWIFRVCSHASRAKFFLQCCMPLRRLLWDTQCCRCVDVMRHTRCSTFLHQSQLAPRQAALWLLSTPEF